MSTAINSVQGTLTSLLVTISTSLLESSSLLDVEKFPSSASLTDSRGTHRRLLAYGVGRGGGRRRLIQIKKIGWIPMFVGWNREKNWKWKKKKGRGRREDPNHTILYHFNWFGQHTTFSRVRKISETQKNRENFISEARKNGWHTNAWWLNQSKWYSINKVSNHTSEQPAEHFTVLWQCVPCRILGYTWVTHKVQSDENIW